MIHVVKLTDEDSLQLSAILEAGVQALSVYQQPLGDKARLALDRFAAQVGQNPVWHPHNDPLLRPRGE